MTLVLEEGDQISHASVAQADDDGILAAVQQFVDLARLKAGAEHADLSRARGQSHAVRARPERPGIVRHGHSRVLLVRAHGQRRKEAVGERDLIIGTDRRITCVREPREGPAAEIEGRGGGGHDEFRAHRPGDR